MLTDQEIIDIFKKYDALLEGHFLLSSGKHSAKYLQCALVLKEPGVSEMLCKLLAEKFKDDKIDKVIGPALGGVVVAYETARHLGVPALFTERVDNKMTLRRGFTIKEGDRVLVLEDVITTGKSVKEVLAVLDELRADVVAVGSLIDRGEGAEFGVPKKSLLSLEVKTYDAADCPLCMQGVDLVKPGSRKMETAK